MKTGKNEDGIVKHLAAALAIALALYVVSFAWIEHRRMAKGPWEVTFQSDGSGHPSLLIRQAALHISETIAFAGETVAAHLAVVERFAEATTNAPFGKIVFQDPTFLPGTLTMEMFGHEVEALPRTLVLDKKEIAWVANGRVEAPKRN